MSSRPGAMVLDPFAGSGSTLIAAELTGRACRVVELEPKYCNLILARWESVTGQQAVPVVSRRPRMTHPEPQSASWPDPVGEVRHGVEGVT